MSTPVVRSFRIFERAAALVMLVLLATVVTYAIGFAIYRTASQLLAIFTGATPPLELDLLHDVFAKFLLILIGLELARTVVMYMDEHVLHVEIVFEVAMIAAARHAIDVSRETSPGHFLGIATVILALGAAYFLYKKATSITSRDAERPTRSG